MSAVILMQWYSNEWSSGCKAMLIIIVIIMLPISACLWPHDEQCWQNSELAEQFRCLESTFSDAAEREWMIVSQRVAPSRSSSVSRSDDAERIVCWLLATYGDYMQNAVYRLTAEQCNGAARERISASQLRPVATLLEVRRGSAGWFDVVTTTDRQTASPGHAGNSGGGHMETAGDDHATADDDWSFSDDSTVINVNDEPHIASDLDGAEQPYVQWHSGNNQQRHSSAVVCLSVAALASASVLLAR